MRYAIRERDVLTSTEAGELLGVSAATVKRWSDEGGLRSIRTRGGHRRFRRADVEEVLGHLRADGAGQRTLADRLAARESVLRIQADLLAERARGSWREVTHACLAAMRTLSNRCVANVMTPLAMRIAQGILCDALTRCADELPSAPDEPTLVVAAVEHEPFTAALPLGRLAARAAGWNAWSVGALPMRELGAFAATHGADAILLFASVSHAPSYIAEALAAAEAACAPFGVALAVTGGAAWPNPSRVARLVRSFSEVGGWLHEISPAG